MKRINFKRSKLFFLGAILFAITIRGQNLVPDPNFSNYIGPPNLTNYKIEDILKYWFSPNGGAPAFITTLQMPLGYNGLINTTPQYYLQPVSGHSYLMLTLFFVDNLGIRNNVRSYASVKLSNPIPKDGWFRLKMNYHSMPGRGTLSDQWSNNLGVVISDSLGYTHGEYINLKPDYNIDTVLRPAYQWLEIDTCVIAVRGGQFLSIGNFFTNSQTITNPNTHYPLQVGIDNISIERMQLTLSNGDTVYGCSNEPLTLEASNDCDYKWALKSNPQNILHVGPQFEVKPTVSTTYLVYGWTDTLEVHVLVDERIGLELGAHQTLCLGDTLTLDISRLKADQIFWSTGDTTETINITQPGWYSVAVARGNCMERDSIRLTYDSLPEVAIHQHQLADCLGADVHLETYAQNDYRYEWNTGEKTKKITTQENGTYWVAVSNFCGTVTDTIVLANEPCLCRIFIANAFSPDSPHEENTVFKPQGTCTYIDYQFTILNRWGMVVFESNSETKSWDGLLPNGQPAPAGVYTYTFFYHGYTEEGSRATERKQGTLTVIR